MDLAARKKQGEAVDSRNIRKHKNDILKIIETPYDQSILANYGLQNEDIVERLKQIYRLK